MQVIQTSGKRKTAIARANLKEGKGIIRINGVLANLISPKIANLKIQEAILLAGDVAKKVDVEIRVKGGGVISRAEAARTALSKALVEFEPSLKEKFLAYDRIFLVSDVRRKETKKPGTHGRARAKRQKSYR
ncbi:MAG: 30S ribosomal protein S9 [Candidatus Woesearchaeota archaeon]